MSRINDSPKSADDQREAARQMALRVNQLERLLERQEFNEAVVEGGKLKQRIAKMGLNNGMTRSNWQDSDITASASDDGVPDTTGKSKYMVLQITDEASPPNYDWDWTRWV